MGFKDWLAKIITSEGRAADVKADKFAKVSKYRGIINKLEKRKKSLRAQLRRGVDSHEEADIQIEIDRCDELIANYSQGLDSLF